MVGFKIDYLSAGQEGHFEMLLPINSNTRVLEVSSFLCNCKDFKSRCAGVWFLL